MGVVRAFYAAAPANAYIRNAQGWKQLQGYVRDMRQDGLATADPVLSAAEPPLLGAPPAVPVPMA